MRKYILLIIIFTWFCPPLQAQQSPFPDNYLINPVSLSPAFTGKYYPFQAFVMYRQEWTGITGAPVIGMVTADAKLGKKMGLGGSLMLNKAGIYRNFTLNLNYAYHLQVAKDHNLSFGLTGVFYQNSVDMGNLIVNDPSDPMLANPDKTIETYFNFGLSVLYNWKDLNVSVAFPMIINNKSLYADTLYENFLTMNRNFLFYTNYKLALANDWKLKFDLLLRKPQYMPLTFDISASVRYAESYWLGVLYRKNNVIGITAGLAIVNTVVLNYTYEFSGSAMIGKSGGTHEISLGCKIGAPEIAKSKSTLKIKDYDR